MHQKTDTSPVLRCVGEERERGALRARLAREKEAKALEALAAELRSEVTERFLEQAIRRTGALRGTRASRRARASRRTRLSP